MKFQFCSTLSELEMEILIIHAYWVSNEDPPKWVTVHELWPPRNATVKMVGNTPVYITVDGPLMKRYNRIIDNMSRILEQKHGTKNSSR